MRYNLIITAYLIVTIMRLNQEWNIIITYLPVVNASVLHTYVWILERNWKINGLHGCIILKLCLTKTVIVTLYKCSLFNWSFCMLFLYNQIIIINIIINQNN